MMFLTQNHGVARIAASALTTNTDAERMIFVLFEILSLFKLSEQKERLIGKLLKIRIITTLSLKM